LFVEKNLQFEITLRLNLTPFKIFRFAVCFPHIAREWLFVVSYVIRHSNDIKSIKVATHYTDTTQKYA